MLEEKVKEVIKRFGLEDEKAITFGHPKMKTKWILPLPGRHLYANLSIGYNKGWNDEMDIDQKTEHPHSLEIPFL